MSHICNYCSLKRMKREAKEKGLRVTLIRSIFALGGTEVFVHPKDIKIRKLGKVEQKKYWKAWLMEISGQCCC